MGAKKPDETLSDHIRMAVRIEFARLAIKSVIDESLIHHHRQDSTELRFARKVLDDITKLQDKLDVAVCQDRPDGIGEWSNHVYRGFIHRDLVGRAANALDLLAWRFADRLSDVSGVEIRFADHDSTTSGRYTYAADEELDDLVNLVFDGGYRVRYALSVAQIRQFCNESIEAGLPPSESQIDNVARKYKMPDDIKMLDDMWSAIVGYASKELPEYADALSKSEAVRIWYGKLIVAMHDDNARNKIWRDFDSIVKLAQIATRIFPTMTVEIVDPSVEYKY